MRRKAPRVAAALGCGIFAISGFASGASKASGQSETAPISQEENVGQGDAHYQQLRTVLLSGEGAPDVVQMEYQYIPSFLVTKSLLDLTPYGAAELEGDYVPWVWKQVAAGGECRQRRRPARRAAAGLRPDGQPVPSRHPRAGWRD